MSQPTLLQRAKSLLASGVAPVLAAVPIAVAVSSTDAAQLTLNPGSTSIGGYSGGQAVTVIESSLDAAALPEFNSVAGIKAFGEATVEAPHDLFVPSTVLFNWSGSVSGDHTGISAIPVDFDFVVTSTGGVIHHVTLAAFVQDGVGVGSLTGSRVIATSGPVDAHGQLDLTPDGAFYGSATWSVEVQVMWSASAGDRLTLAVPQNSIDVNPVPEPAAAGVLLVAGATLLLRRR